MMKYEAFDRLCGRVRFCTACPRMDASQRVLGRSAGALDAEVIFVGEAPGRLGADASGIPFHGDQAGHNFESLLEFAGLSRRHIFVTNAVLCNPRDDEGRNSTPLRSEIQNCTSHLKSQIDLVNPRIVVTLGSVALEALRHLEAHTLQLSTGVRTLNRWYGRTLIPLYHPGQRAMLHRSFANQRSDYQFVADQLRRLRTRSAKAYGRSKSDVISVVRAILASRPQVSYFALHKLLYLMEYEAFKKFGRPLTTAYFIRQKDGPYCTDLHLQRIKRAIPDLRVLNEGRTLMLRASQGDFLEVESNHAKAAFSVDVSELVGMVLTRYGDLSDAALKTKVYLTTPMREILRRERDDLVNLYNTPIEFSGVTPGPSNSAA